MNLLLYLTLKFEFTSSEALSPTKIQKRYIGEEREGGAKPSIYMGYIFIDKISKHDFSKIYKCDFDLTSLTHLKGWGEGARYIFEESAVLSICIKECTRPVTNSLSQQGPGNSMDFSCTDYFRDPHPQKMSFCEIPPPSQIGEADIKNTFSSTTRLQIVSR